MAGKPRALALCPEAPYPMWGGGALRTASLLNYLGGRYDTDVLLFSDRAGWDPAAALPSGLAARSGVIPMPEHSRSTAARVLRNARRLAQNVPPLVDRFAGFENEIADFIHGRYYELAVIEHFWCAHYQPLLREHANRVVLDLHNVESQLHRRYGQAEGGWQALAHERFAKACERLERVWLPRFDHLLVTSDVGASLPNAIVYPNTLPLTPAPARDEKERIIFSGNMEYHPNVQAVKWFAAHVWPWLAVRHPALEWRLAGKNEHAVRSLVSHLPRVHLTGMIEDAAVELAQARVAVVPLLSGSGTRLKILEAWAAGTPVVSTPLGAEGLGELEDLPLVLASNGPEIAEAIDGLLTDTGRRSSLASRARELFEQRFTWPAAWERLRCKGI